MSLTARHLGRKKKSWMRHSRLLGHVCGRPTTNQHFQPKSSMHVSHRDMYEGKTQAQSQTRVTQPGRDVIVTRRAQDSKLREPP